MGKKTNYNPKSLENLKSGQKKAGVPHKLTADVKNFIFEVAQKKQETPETSIESIDNETFWVHIFGKIIPKDINVQAQLWTRQLSDEELEKRLEQIEKELQDLQCRD